MDDFVPTRASQNRKNAEKALEITTFETRKKMSNPAKKIVNKDKKPKDDAENDFDEEDMEDDDPPMDDRRKQELEMKRFRYEVIKLGISALDKKKARAAKVELAISLGAKPPKNKRRNYKKILAEKKLETIRKNSKNKLASGFDPSKLLMNKPSKVKVKKKLIKKKSPVEDIKKTGKDGMKKGKGKGKGKKNSGGILGMYGRVTKAKEHQNSGGKKQKRN
ncbi:uncharacterized protein LOC131675682 [Phymastichus coffea]|uniref:uncharacterized protein LOC131675682 n=1 Tax=Phymastichus coffea TaxID=108790 RepID=UPI00273C2FF4|nr:uncharacterized protein LOC131675682 [Phymastichus coffea]